MPTGTLVKSASATTAGTSIALTSLPAAITVGQTLVIAVCLRAAGTVSAADNSTQTGTANTYTKLTTPDSTNTVRLVVLTCKVTRQILTTNTITITIPSSVYAALAVVYGPYVDGTVDVAPAATTGSTTAETMPASGVRAQAQEVVLGISAQAQNGTTFTAGSGFSAFTAITNGSSTSCCIGIEDQLTAGTATVTPAATGGSNAYVAGTVSIRASTAVTTDVTSSAAVLAPANHYVGSFACPAAAGSLAVAPADMPPFTPTWVRFWGVNATADSDTGNQLRGFMGMAVSSSARAALSWTDTASLASHQDNAACIWLLSSSTTTPAMVADFTSFVAGGFNLNFTTVSSGVIVNYECGDDPQAQLVQFRVPATTGTQTVTTSFRPGHLFFMTTGDSQTPPSSRITPTAAPWTAVGIGATDGTSQWVSSNDADGTNSEQYQRTDKCIALISAGAVKAEAAISSVSNTGFTVNWTTVTSGIYVWGLALGGNSYKVGALTQPSATGTQASSTLAFTPIGVQFASAMQVAGTSIVGATTTGEAFGFGAMVDATHRGAIGLILGGTGTTAIASLSRTAAITLLNATPAVAARADFSAVASGNFTVNWTSADATARQVVWTAYGGPAPTRDIFTAAAVSQSVTRDVTSAAATSCTVTRDVTSAAAASAPATRDVTSTAAVQAAVIRDVTSAAAASQSVTRDVTSAAATSQQVTRDVSSAASTAVPATVTRDVTSAAATSATVTRDVTSTAASSAPVTRDVTTGAAAQITGIVRNVTSAGALLLTPTRDVTSTAAAQAAVTRDVQSALAVLLTPSRDVTSAAAPSQTVTRDVTSLAATSCTVTRDVTSAAAASQSVTRDVTSLAAASVSGITRDVTSQATALTAGVTRDVTSGASIQVAGVLQSDVVTEAAASITGITRSVTSAGALLLTPSRDVSTAASSLLTPSRDVTSGAAALLTPTRDVTSTAAVQATVTRDITSAGAASQSVTRDVTSAAAGQVTGITRDVSSSAAASQAVTRDVSSAASSLLTPRRDVTSAVAVTIPGLTQTDVTSVAATSAAVTRDITTAGAAAQTATRTVTSAAALAQQVTRDVSSAASAAGAPYRDVTTQAAAQARASRDVASAAAVAGLRDYHLGVVAGPPFGQWVAGAAFGQWQADEIATWTASEPLSGWYVSAPFAGWTAGALAGAWAGGGPEA